MDNEIGKKPLQKTASRLLLDSAIPFDAACVKVLELEEENAELKKANKELIEALTSVDEYVFNCTQGGLSVEYGRIKALINIPMLKIANKHDDGRGGE